MKKLLSLLLALALTLGVGALSAAACQKTPVQLDRIEHIYGFGREVRQTRTTAATFSRGLFGQVTAKKQDSSDSFDPYWYRQTHAALAQIRQSTGCTDIRSLTRDDSGAILSFEARDPSGQVSWYYTFSYQEDGSLDRVRIHRQTIYPEGVPRPYDMPVYVIEYQYIY